MNRVKLTSNSRYLGTDLKFTEEDGEFWSIWRSFELPKSSKDRYITLSQRNAGMRADNLSYEFYGTSDLWWALCLANNVNDPFEQWTDQESSSVSNTVYGNPTERLSKSDDLQMFQLLSKRPGPKFNSYSGNKGLRAKSGRNWLQIFFDGEKVEEFYDLARYPEDPNGDEDPTFWVHINSAYIDVKWLNPHTIRPSAGGVFQAPIPRETNIIFEGGRSYKSKTIRVPDIEVIKQTLSSL